MKQSFLILLLLASANARAGRNDQVKKDMAILEARWKGCYQSSGEAFYDCLKATALDAATYYDKNVAYFGRATLARPNADAKVKRYLKIQANYLKYRSSQCEFEGVMKSEKEGPAFVQKARCHFRTAIDFVLLMNDLLSL